MRSRINRMQTVLCLICSILGALLVSGCGRDSKVETMEVQQDVITEDEGSAETEEEVIQEDTSVEVIADENKEETEQTQDSTEAAESIDVINNNGHFVQIGNKIYFHIVDADSMGRSALWANYADTECGRTVLFAYDFITEEIEAVAYDYTSGGISAQGKDIYYQAYIPTMDGMSYDSTVLSRYSYDDNVKLPDLLANGDSILGAAPNGTFIATYHCDYEGDNSIQQISIYKDGVLQKTVDTEDYCSCVAVSDTDIFYICGQPDNGYNLMQLNVMSWESVDLGMLPGFEYSDWNGYVDECIVNDEGIYFTYSTYEGTGNFFSEGYFVQAKTGVEDSLIYENMPGALRDGEPVAATFAVVDGRMGASDGEPNTCKVNENGDLGYYDDNGNWNMVASGWVTEFLNDDGDYKGVELAELVGDSIYLIYNDNARVPDDDIGWRYAYCRNYTDVYKVSVKTGESVQLVHQVAPWGD